MVNLATKVEWHDLRIAPDDIPDEGENVLVTVELLDGTRRTQADVYLKLDDDTYSWYTRTYIRDRHIFEEAAVWYEVVAWAYYPEPYCKYWY